jgi:Dolichyl-phosphate-mannose-protein mannosyltransferase
VLESGGVAVFVTPNRLTFARPEEVIDPYHYLEFDGGELRRVCSTAFEQVELHGIFGSARYLELVEAQRRKLDALLRLDPLKLRRLLPRALRQRLYDRGLTRERASADERTAAIEPGDFRLGDEGLDESLDLVAVCRRPRPTPLEGAPRNPAHRGFGSRLATIAAAGLALRLLYVLAFTRGLHGSGDSAFFSSLGNLIGEGRGFVNPIGLGLLGQTTPTALHPPLFPLVLGLGSWLGIHSYLAQRVIVSIIGAASIVAVGLLGRRVAGERAGIIAAGLAAIYPVLISADGAVMSESLYGLLVVASLLAAYRLVERPSVLRGAALGVAIGLAALTRAEALALFVLLVLPAARRAWWTLAVAVVTCALVLVPWTLRNESAFHSFVLVSDNSGTLIAGANCDATYHGRRLGSWDIFCVRGIGHTTNETRAASGERRAGLRYARRHAARLPAVLAVRALRTFDLWQPLHEARVAEGRAYGIEVAGAVAFWMLVPVAIAGALALRARRMPLFPLGAPFALALLVSLAGYGLPRFRHPADLALVVLAAVALDARPGVRWPARWERARPGPRRDRAGDAAAPAA